ncbi:hypothetical protein [Thalassolituus oleivorans]|uniref:DNA-binding protein n=1 Tax=Thalassolituus oleivorans MIL-1 TaxID=1298593 RepID=M5DRU4_9GAMM|nr:hypothetical protein [Thalassolituus oleivorans]CCU72631.1 hypothetical protein TOL_2227 [Thalassolituus oleivorans MIL-1]
MKLTPSERLSLLMDTEKLKTPFLEQRTGIKADRWKNVKSGRTELRVSEVEALKYICPEYCYWLATGEELPEAGQISPMTKKLTMS